MHASRLKLPPNDEAIAFLTKAAPLHTPEWDAWSARTRTANLAGRWLVTASLLGHGKYFGEMQVDTAGDDEFTTTVHLTSVNDGSTIVRSGRSVVYGSYAWRGRSKGSQSGELRPPTMWPATRAKSCGSRPISRQPRAAGSGASIRNSASM